MQLCRSHGEGTSRHRQKGEATGTSDPFTRTQPQSRNGKLRGRNAGREACGSSQKRGSRQKRSQQGSTRKGTPAISYAIAITSGTTLPLSLPKQSPHWSTYAALEYVRRTQAYAET